MLGGAAFASFAEQKGRNMVSEHAMLILILLLAVAVVILALAMVLYVSKMDKRLMRIEKRFDGSSASLNGANTR